MNSPAPAPTSIKRYGLRLAVAAAGLAVLLIISPGVGVDSASYGWWDVWRARLGWEISQDELVGRPLVDLNGDGVISAEERDGFVAVARTMFNLRFPRALLALQVGMTLALCGAVFQVLFRNPLATAAVVAHCGPIGFVGLVVPHMVSLVVGSDCRILLPASAIAGGAFLIICDWVSQLCMRVAGWVSGQQLGSATLPIGVVTAVVGVPIFLVLLRARRR